MDVNLLSGDKGCLPKQSHAWFCFLRTFWQF